MANIVFCLSYLHYDLPRFLVPPVADGVSGDKMSSLVTPRVSFFTQIFVDYTMSRNKNYNMIPSV